MAKARLDTRRWEYLFGVYVGNLIGRSAITARLKATELLLLPVR